MKLKLSYYSFLLPISLCIGCQNELAMPDNSWGFFTAKVNGRAWEKTFANAYQAVRGRDDLDSAKGNTIEIYSLLFDSGGVLEEELSFTNIPAKVGRYKVFPYNDRFNTNSGAVGSFLTTFIDFDMFRDQYEVLESEDNYLQIDECQDKGNREIKGRFNVTFVLRSKRASNSYEDTLGFTKGKFHTKIVPPIKRHL